MAKAQRESIAPGQNVRTWARVGKTEAQELEIIYDIGVKSAGELRELAERVGWAGCEGELFKMLMLGVIEFWKKNV